MLSDTEILKLWRSPTFEGSYSGIKTFQIFLHLNLNEDISENRLYKILKDDPIFLIHQKSPKIIERRKYDLRFYGELVQIDIAYMFPFEDYKYFLLLIDCFSSKIFTAPLKQKDSKSVSIALENLIKEFKSQIYEIQSDQGTEFKGATKEIFKKHKILFKIKQGRNKANFAENGILIVKRRLYKLLRGTLSQDWIKNLAKVTVDYNNTPLKHLGYLTPNSITSEFDSINVQNSKEKYNQTIYTEPSYKNQRKNQLNYNLNPKNLKEGDFVYINFPEKQFDKSFDTQVNIILFYKNISFFYEKEQI